MHVFACLYLHFCASVLRSVLFLIILFVVPGSSISFSSYPGKLQSEDDYYIMSSGLVRKRGREEERKDWGRERERENDVLYQLPMFFFRLLWKLPMEL